VLGPGTLYGAIGRLEERGLIAAADGEEAGSRRRPYRLTAEGAAALRETLDGLRAVVDTGGARLAAAPRSAFA
jgi:DNA-binding PadR family transcriptional regulator